MRNFCKPNFLISFLLLASFGAAAADAQNSTFNCSSSDKSTLSSEDYDRPVSWKLLAPNILCDQKAIWLFPLNIWKDGNWIPTVAVAGTTAALFALDPIEARYFHQTTAFHGFNNVFSSNATAIGTVIAPVSVYAAGLIRHDPKMEYTALLAGQAVADSEIVATVFRAIDRRARPSTFAQSSNYWDSWYEKRVSGTSGSFPSGHTIAAFSIATVIAHRYHEHRWVPYAAYGAAALVGFSRLTLSAHFTSDVFAGAALGYSISRFAVLHY